VGGGDTGGDSIGGGGVFNTGGGGGLATSCVSCCNCAVKAARYKGDRSGRLQKIPQLIIVNEILL